MISYSNDVSNDIDTEDNDSIANDWWSITCRLEHFEGFHHWKWAGKIVSSISISNR